MFRRLFPPSSDAASSAVSAGAGSRPRSGGGEPDLATFPVVGITRRRAATLLGVLVMAWIVILFARQVGDAALAAERSAALVAANAQRTAEVASLEQELEQIQQPAYVTQQARGYGLGGPREIAFSLEPGAPPLAPDSPGSAALRVGAPAPVAPLERWLTSLFGPPG